MAARPLGRASHGVLELAAVDAGGRNLVETHRDVAAQVALDLGGELRGEAGRRAVVDVAKRDSVVIDGEQRVAEREDLETARVGEDRPVPAHEPVQPAELRDQCVAGAEVQVVGIAEQDLGA